MAFAVQEDNYVTGYRSEDIAHNVHIRCPTSYYGKGPGHQLVPYYVECAHFALAHLKPSFVVGLHFRT